MTQGGNGASTTADPDNIPRARSPGGAPAGLEWSRSPTEARDRA